jgi:hypothetical protein
LSWRAWFPAVVLAVVAGIQVVLVRTADLSPWKGGGFGMFATTDGTAFRYVRLYVEGPDRSEELEVAPSLEDAAARARLFPSVTLMTRLAEKVVARERRYSRPVSSVKVEVWRTHFTTSPVKATDELLRSFTMKVRNAAEEGR